MLLKDIMQKNIVTLSPESTLRDVARLMKEDNVGCVVIMNGQRLKGIITDRDIACWVAEGKDPNEVTAGSIMKRHVIIATPEMSVFEAGKLMADNKVRRLPVVAGNKLCGLVSISDLASIIEAEVDNFFHVEEAYHH